MSAKRSPVWAEYKASQLPGGAYWAGNWNVKQTFSPVVVQSQSTKSLNLLERFLAEFILSMAEGSEMTVRYFVVIPSASEESFPTLGFKKNQLNHYQY